MRTALITPSSGDVGVVAEFFGGDQRSSFLKRIDDGQRLGQAFMNALPVEDYVLLCGGLIDPFHKDDLESVLKAIDWLTTGNIR